MSGPLEKTYMSSSAHFLFQIQLRNKSKNNLLLFEHSNFEEFQNHEILNLNQFRFIILRRGLYYKNSRPLTIDVYIVV